VDRAARRLHADEPVAARLEARDTDATAELGAARPGDLQGERARLEPAIASAVARIADLGGQVGEATAGLGAVKELDVQKAPLMLGGYQVLLLPCALIGQRREEIPLVPQPKPGPLMHLIEEVDALPNQLNLLGVVELEAERSGGNGRRERCQGRSLLQHERLEAGAFREQGGGASDDASTDDDEIGGLGR